MKTHVLLIDDCPSISKMLSVIVDRYFSHSVSLTVSNTLEDGLRAIKNQPPDVVLLDFCLKPYTDCSRTIPSVRTSGFKGPLYLWSNHDRRTIAYHSSRVDAQGFFQKQEYSGIKLQTLVRDHLCASKRVLDHRQQPHKHGQRSCLGAQASR